MKIQTIKHKVCSAKCGNRRIYETIEIAKQAINNCSRKLVSVECKFGHGWHNIKTDSLSELDDKERIERGRLMTGFIQLEIDRKRFV